MLTAGREVTDWGRMQRATVCAVAQPTSEAEVQEIVRAAAARGLTVSLRGAGHSAGGHSFRDGGVMIDLRGLNRILELDTERRTLRVQSGATWEVLTRALEPAGLAITTKQEFNTFTIGGSVAANVHGKSIDYGPLIESIVRLRIVTGDGAIVSASRDEHPDLFRAVVGGYGLLGVVVEVTFRLVEDRPVRKSEVVFMDADSLIPAYLERVNRDRRATPLCYGFLDSACRRGFYVTYTYTTGGSESVTDGYRRDEPNPILFNRLVALLRAFKIVRRRSFHLLWSGSDKPEVTLRSRRLLLWDRAPAAFKNLLLPKYFVPPERFSAFIRAAGDIFGKYEDDLPLMTNHFRFVPGNGEALLSFARDDRICLIPCYLARKDDRTWVGTLERATAELLDACLEHGGSYYLTFDIIASPEQFDRAYPEWKEFVAVKRKYDPRGLFSSRFYEKYAG